VLLDDREQVGEEPPLLLRQLGPLDRFGGRPMLDAIDLAPSARQQARAGRLAVLAAAAAIAVGPPLGATVRRARAR
jgi:hypothetical protein